MILYGLRDNANRMMMEMTAEEVEGVVLNIL